MSSQINLFAMLQDLKSERNAHNSGMKRVFTTKEQSGSALTQFAFGTMTDGQSSGFHAHETMDEYFYFISGTGLFSIGEEKFEVGAQTFIRAPAALRHNLEHTNIEPLEFVYFGIAV